ncbi:MAG: hypothetical protein ACOZNI_01490 [Myxococcota bacterium]
MWWALPAIAAPVTEATLVEMLEQVGPKVEAVAGRALLARPPMIIDDRAHVHAALVAPPPWATDDTPALAEARRAEADALLSHALAVYDPSSMRIYVVSDTMRRLLSETQASDAMVRPFVECVLAHELTHALQQQWVAVDGAPSPGQKALLEGHASWVAHRVCTGGAEAYARAVEGFDLASSADPADPDVFAYVWGERWVDAWIARHGRDAFWWRLAQPPPARADLAAVVEPQLAPGWRDGEALADAVAGPLAVEGWAREVYPASPFALLAGILGAEMGLGNAVGASGGLVAQFSRGGQSAIAMAFLLDDAAAARRWVETRDGDLLGYDVRLLSTRPLTFLRVRKHGVVPEKRRPPGAERTLEHHVDLVDGERYHELWATRGPVVYGVARAGEPHEKGVGEALAALMEVPLATAAPGVASSPAAEALLAGDAPPAELGPARPSALWYATRAASAPDPAACLAEAEGAIPKVAPARLETLVGVAVDCARKAKDVDAAARLAAHAASGAAWDTANLVIAEVLIDGGRAADALARLDAVAEERAIRGGLRLRALVALRRWREIAPLLADESVAPEPRAWAATHLYNAGRKDEALRALGALCPRLSDPAERDQCLAEVRRLK